MSGWQKRKKNKEKKQNEHQLLLKVPRLESFFTPLKSSPSISSSASVTNDHQLEKRSDCEVESQNQIISENSSTIIEKLFSDDPIA